jgi:protein-glutamine gamma-glutamyltransferase
MKLDRPSAFFALYLFTLLPLVETVAPSILIVSLISAALAFVAERRPAWQPSRGVLGVLTVGGAGWIYLRFGTLLGPEPATALLTLLFGLKLFEVHSRRDTLVFLALCLTVSMYVLLERQDLLTTVYMVIVLLAVFYAIHRRHQPLALAVHGGLSFRSFLGPETLVSLPLALVMFFFFPRLTSPLGRLIEGPDRQTGFSNELRAGEMARLSDSDAIAFRVYFDGAQPPLSALYFFGQSLSQSDGINWTAATANDRRQAPSSVQLLTKTVTVAPTGRPTATVSSGGPYSIVMEPRFEKQTFFLSGTGELTVRGTPFGLQSLPSGAVLLGQAATGTFQLEGRSEDIETPGPPAALSSLTTLPPRFLEKNPQLNEWVRSFQRPTRRETTDALLQGFRDLKLTYSRTTPNYRSLDEILFQKKVGFCEHFASAFALSARALGVPTRVVVGFQGGEINRFGGYLVVRDRQAHAWTEFLDEADLWRLVDPTAVVDGQRITLGMTAEDSVAQNRLGFLAWAQTAQMLFDTVNNRVVLFLLNFDGEVQVEWLRDLGFSGLNRRSLWILFASVTFTALALIFLGLRFRKTRLSAIERSRRVLNEKLSAIEGFRPNLGFSECYALTDQLERKNPELAKTLRGALREHATLAYDRPTRPNASTSV